MANTFILMGEALEALRATTYDPDIEGNINTARHKLGEAVSAFQEFEKRYNRDRLQRADFDALEAICRSDIESPAFYKGEFHWGNSGQRAAAILARHGVVAHLNGDNKQVTFEKVMTEEEQNGAQRV